MRCLVLFRYQDSQLVYQFKVRLSGHALDYNRLKNLGLNVRNKAGYCLRGAAAPAESTYYRNELSLGPQQVGQVSG
ncbi:MAG: hypothetical protein AAB359_04255, partial [Elusimicrobiota bacterium]